MKIPRSLLLGTTCLALAWLDVAGAAAAQTPPSYRVDFLGPVLGVRRLTDAGVVIGSATIGGNVRGWIASAGTPVSPLPLPPAFVSSYANDISDAGVIVGAVGAFYSPEFGPQAVAWHPDGAGGYTIQMLGKLPGHVGSNAVALNGVGDIVGYSTNGTFRSPVLFTAPGGVLDLSATGVFDPQAINDERVLVDRSFDCKRLDLDTMVAESLGQPSGPPSYSSASGAAINRHGHVAGVAILATSTSCLSQAARYTDGIGWQVLSMCGSYSGAHDINDRGDVVMRLNVAPYVRFEGLGSYLIEDLIAPTTGHWYVQNSYGLAINDGRQIAVVANNLATGENGAILLTPIQTCQADIGFGGPGDGVLGVCGGDLSSGTTAAITLHDAPPFQTAFFAASAASNPTPLLGGMVVPLPILALLVEPTGPWGTVTIDGIVGGGGPSNLYVQCVYTQPALAQSFGFSNAVRLDFLP